MKILGVGIIGCGAISSVHLESIHALPQADIKVVCDIEESRARFVAEAEGCSWVTDYDQVLEDDTVDIVHILTPHYLHVSMAIKAIEFGKHVVLEKPVGIHFEELLQLQKAADKSDLTVGVALQNRFNPTTVKMKEIIASGTMGKLIASKGILTWCRKECYYSESKWRGRLATEGGGLLINQAIHTLDLMEYIGGFVETLKAHVVNNTHPDIEVEDTAMIMMNYASGAVGNFYGTTSYGEDSRIELGFIFENGKLSLENQKLYITKNGQTELLAADLLKNGEKSYWGMSHKLIIKDIYQAILTDSELMVSLKDAIRATELVLLAYEK